LVRVVTRRFGVQERMTHQIAGELDRLMPPIRSVRRFGDHLLLRCRVEGLALRWDGQLGRPRDRPDRRDLQDPVQARGPRPEQRGVPA